MPSKPILLTVDDDPDVLRAIERDVRRHYGQDYRVLRAEAGATALGTVRQLDARGEPVALFLVDQRMPRMSGIEFLEQARSSWSRPAPSSPPPSAYCSPPTPTRTRRSRRSTRSGWTTMR
jgi:CheY-like chemotaxis protein